MSNIFETETKIKQIIDELKALSAQAGLANQGEEERIITSVFLYKFLNDKLTCPSLRKKSARPSRKF